MESVDQEPPAVRPGPDDRPAASVELVAEVITAFGLPRPRGWKDLGGSRSTNLKLDGPGREPVVVRIHRPSTTPARLAAMQAARTVVVAAGIPAVRPLPAPDGGPFVRLPSGRLAELEPYVRWNERMNTEPLLERGFATLGRVHDALRDGTIPAAAERADHANHLPSERAADATRRGAARIRGWRDPRLSRLADQVVRHVEVVTAAEEPLRDKQVDQLVHGDFWDDNVLFADGELAAVIDFDFMARRPRIDDLALTIYFFLLEPGRGLPTAYDRGRIRRFVDAYDSGTARKLSAAERAALPLAIARQPAWSIGRWAVELAEAEARRHVGFVVDEFPVAHTVLSELPRWQDALG